MILDQILQLTRRPHKTKPNTKRTFDISLAHLRNHFFAGLAHRKDCNLCDITSSRRLSLCEVDLDTTSFFSTPRPLVSAQLFLFSRLHSLFELPLTDRLQ